MGISVLNPAAAAGGFDPTKLTLRHTITSTTNNIGIPADVTNVYVKMVGGGGGGSGGAFYNQTTGFTNKSFNTGIAMGGAGAGGYWEGWVPASNKAIIGAGGNGGTSWTGNDQNNHRGGAGGSTIYSGRMAGGGGAGGSANSSLNDAGGGYMGTYGHGIGSGGGVGGWDDQGGNFALWQGDAIGWTAIDAMSAGMGSGFDEGQGISLRIQTTANSRPGFGSTSTNFAVTQFPYTAGVSTYGRGGIGARDPQQVGANTNLYKDGTSGVWSGGGGGGVNRNFAAGNGGNGGAAGGGGAGAYNSGNNISNNGGNGGSGAYAGVTINADKWGGGGGGLLAAGSVRTGGSGGGGGGGGNQRSSNNTDDSNPGGAGGGGALLIYY